MMRFKFNTEDFNLLLSNLRVISLKFRSQNTRLPGPRVSTDYSAIKRKNDDIYFLISRDL